MKVCAWCGSFVDELFNYSGADICKSCKESVEHSVCRKCGETYPEELMMKGLCLNCMQIESAKQNKRRDEAMLGLGGGMDVSGASGELEMTDEDYEKWMLLGDKTITPAMLKRDMTARRIWIMVKLNAAGIYDDEIINKNMADIEELLDENFSKIIKNKCRFVVLTSMRDRSKLGNDTCIAHKNNVFILAKS